MSTKQKRRYGDRFDGKQLRDVGSMQVITSILYPNRCDNEAYINETIDMAPIRAYVEKKNSEEGVLFPYTPFHIIVAAVIKVLTLRPKLNRFIANRLMYQRNEVSVSFVVKKLFSDSGAEALAIIHAEDEDTIDTIHKKLYDQISSSRSDKIDKSTEEMDNFSKLPPRLVRFVVRFICFLDRIGKCPRSLIETDPYYTSCLLSNVGSLKLKSGYHHLTNWGTCSLFVMVGNIGPTIGIDENGNVGTYEAVKLGLTVDERISDGYYCSKTVRLLKAILANPEVLELPMNQDIDY